MVILLLLLCLSVPGAILGQTVAIDHPVATPTQAVIHVSVSNSNGTPYTSACFYRISEGSSFTARVNDVNTALFAGADSDARPGSIINGKDHYFVAGTRTSARAADGKFYSRALQAATLHWVGVTCGASPEVSTTFVTQNPPLGNTYPELPPFDSAAFGNAAFPTVDFATRNSAYIDPLSGILLKLISLPKDMVTDSPTNTRFTFFRDINGSAWTNAANALADHNPATLASTSTPNAPLFLSWDYLQDSQLSWDLEPVVYDMQLRAYGTGSSGAVLQACVSIDGGQTCATDAVDMALPSAAGEVKGPASYPMATFGGWNPHAILSGPVISNGGVFTVNVAGHTVTWVSETKNLWYGTNDNQFWITRPPGTKLKIAGTDPVCPNNLCTVVSYDSPTQITIAENMTTPVNNATLLNYGAGILVWLKNTGGSPNASVSFTYDYVNSAQQLSTVNAGLESCGLPLTDIATDKDGTPYTDGPKTGFLCNVAGTLFLWIPSLGEARLMSRYFKDVYGYMNVPVSPFSTTDPKVLFGSDHREGHVWKATLNVQNGVYREWAPGDQYPPVMPDNLTWTDITAASPSIDSQVLTMFAGKPVANMLAAGIMPSFGYMSTISGYPAYESFGGQDSPCMIARTSADNTVIQAFTTWDHYPLRWGACHFGPGGVGKYMWVTLNVIDKESTNVPLGGPWTLNVTQMKYGPNWRSFTGQVAAATNANPAQLTSPGHALDPGWPPTITISGATGSWAAINGVHQVTVNDSDHFSVNGIDSSSFGALTGSVTFTAAPPMIHSNVTGVSGNPAVVTVSTANHRFQDGDGIGFGNLDQSVQYYAKATGYSNTSFAVYRDAALTQPVNASTLGAAIGGTVYFAETCPSDVDPEFTTNMRFDTGATGVRCITIRVAGEPCSSFASAAEHAFAPCKSDPSNPAKSYLQDLQPGDFLADKSGNAYRESFVVLKKVKNSETNIELTLMRWWGNKVTADTHLNNLIHGTHSAGWTALMVPSYLDPAEVAWMDPTDPTATALVLDPRYGGAHGDLGDGSADGLYSYANGFPDPFVDKTPAEILAWPLTFTANSNPDWANAPSTQWPYGSLIQSYPGHRQKNAPHHEQTWKGDWRAMLPDLGNGQSQEVPFNANMTVTSIRGTTYDPSSATSRVYKVSNMAGGFDRKRTPFYSWAGANMLHDISAPGSLITDANSYAFCVADNPGECRPNSAKNDSFVSLPAAHLGSGRCWSNGYNFNAPCFTGANPLAGWATQEEISPIDTKGKRIRRLTTGLVPPGTHWTFMNWLQTPWQVPGPNWGFFVSSYVSGLANRYFALKVPPFPGQSNGRDDWSVNRGTFVPQRITLGPNVAFPFARARFGYAENGPAANFYCTARQEACSTEIPVSTPTDPYSFVSESVNRLQCGSGCTLSIPAISGRVLYYVIDRFDGSGNVVTSPMQAVARP